VAFNWLGRSRSVGYFTDEEVAARACDAASPLASSFAAQFPDPASGGKVSRASALNGRVCQT
jgi:hypothetical protein